MKKHIRFGICLLWLTMLQIPFITGRGQAAEYRFSKEKALNYGFSIKGDISYGYEGTPEQNFAVEAKGVLTLETMQYEDGVYRIKMTPSKTLVKVNDMLVEDTRERQETSSQIISSAIMEIKKNGEVLSAEETSGGILNLSQMLMLLPAFPEKTRSGSRWKQTVPSFSLPGIPMCSLEFNYLYSKRRGTPVTIELLANNVIKERHKEENGMTVNFAGRNVSRGTFIFDETKGEIENFQGNMDLLMNVGFEMPPGPGRESSTKQTIPMKMNIKLEITLVRVQ